MVEFVGENNLDALVDDLDVPFWVDERCEYRPALRTQANTVQNVHIKYLNRMGLPLERGAAMRSQLERTQLARAWSGEEPQALPAHSCSPDLGAV